MEYYIWMCFGLGFYGYFKFAYTIWKGKNIIKNVGRNVDSSIDKLRLIDIITGIMALLVSFIYKVQNFNDSLFVIITLYGVVLIIKGLKGFSKGLQKNIVCRKVYNYIANSYIIFSIWLLSSVIEAKGIEGGTIAILALYFATYYIIWKIV
ncbi:hypothetical protein [Anaerocellum danielii]|uniref:Uncharacterized protein n=1 Tax=Anaerocellum danielii TaxID=1387557 RepID=A0ABZ0U1W8_9FIRM|nr:hypothetical protein [Caldicellulosiruptor danielii]WPX09670.1 hypothetical protein SOJ16_000903 [Caldicellulosiruptor danielii]